MLNSFLPKIFSKRDIRWERRPLLVWHLFLRVASLLVKSVLPVEGPFQRKFPQMLGVKLQLWLMRLPAPLNNPRYIPELPNLSFWNYTTKKSYPNCNLWELLPGLITPEFYRVCPASMRDCKVSEFLSLESDSRPGTYRLVLRNCRWYTRHRRERHMT